MTAGRLKAKELNILQSLMQLHLPAACSTAGVSGCSGAPSTCCALWAPCWRAPRCAATPLPCAPSCRPCCGLSWSFCPAAGAAHCCALPSTCKEALVPHHPLLRLQHAVMEQLPFAKGNLVQCCCAMQVSSRGTPSSEGSTV